jgi:predicted nucleic acid-binding protein
MLVVDASVLVEYLAGGEHAKAARRWIVASEGVLWAPHLIDAEIGHVLRRGVGRGELSAARAQAALNELGGLPLRHVAHRGLLRRAWELRGNLSFYDALYVALAERLKVPLVTLDGRIAGAPGVRACIETIR